MVVGLYLLKIFLLGFVAWQDFKYRGVYWFLFPLLIGIRFLKISVLKIPWSAGNISINLLLLLFMLGFLYVWMRMRKEHDSAIRPYLGLGDVLFFVVLTTIFPPMAFVGFQLLSLTITLIAAILLRIKAHLNDSVPLAGFQAVLLIPFMGYEFYIYPLFVNYSLLLETLMKS